MEEISGVVSEVGDYVATNMGQTFYATYSHVAIGDRVLRKLKALSGIAGKLQEAVSTGDQVTLYKTDDILCGIKFSNGKVYASDIPYSIFSMIFMLVIGIVLTPLFGIGLIFLYGSWKMYRALSIGNDAKAIPNAIVI